MASDTQYTPTVSIEENMQQIQTRAQVERAEMMNKIYSAARYAGRFAVVVQDGISSESGEQDKNAVHDDTDSKAVSGSEVLPDNVNLLVKERNQRRALGKKAKVLSYDFKVDALSPVAILQAGSFGLISKDNPVLAATQAVQGKFQSDQPVAHRPGMYVPNPLKQKVLEQPDTSLLAFLQTDSDFREAAASADDYLVTSSADLSKIYEASGFSETGFSHADSPDMGVSADVQQPDNAGSVLLRGHEQFFEDIMQNGSPGFEQAGMSI